MMDEPITPARFGPRFEHVITSDGEKVALDDPRVVHVFPFDFSPHLLDFLASSMKKHGWRCRVAGRTTLESLKRGKELASGRECLPCVAVIGETCTDLAERRKDGEITIYYEPDQDGPCQNAMWPLIWQTFAERKRLKDVVTCAWPSPRNDYMGRGGLFALDIALAFVVSDLLDEAELVVRCLAEDRDAAMGLFRREAVRVVESAPGGYFAVEAALRRWAKAVRRIGLRGRLAEAPKVLIFGGANLPFCHRPVSDYFVEQGVVPKVVDVTEFLVFLESEDVTRYGFKIGQGANGNQMKVWPLILSLAKRRYRTAEGMRALQCRAHIRLIDFMFGRLRRICRRSGLLHDRRISFRKIYEEGSRSVSPNGYTEVHLGTGRFTASVKHSCFDAFVNAGAFNCQPAMNTQACVRAIANTLDVPYASLDLEGPFVSASQRRLLETLAVQAKRVRSARNAGRYPRVGHPAPPAPSSAPAQSA
jgi:predicted nucleotide-binding protein (sugar kinase/HSP70/actin superfamily)